MPTSPGSMRSTERPVDRGISIRWHDVAADADRALREQVALVAGVDPQAVEVGRQCGRCGSSEHGRPWASHGVHVSLSRSGPYLVTAVSTSGPVGVDVESVAAVDRAWADLTSLFEPGPVMAGSGRAAWWCRLEAVLKRDGTGLGGRIDPARLDLGLADDLVAPAGYCAAVAVTTR